VLALLGIGGFLGGSGLILWGVLLLNPKGGRTVPDERRMQAIALIVTGGVLMAGTTIYSFIDSSMGANRMLKQKLKRELANRPSPLVDPNDPSALFVEIVPKANWGRTMLDNASDIGLLIVDRGRREVRFEGDKERYRIPAAALMSCEVESYTFGKAQLYFVVLNGRQRDGVWEAPFRERRGAGRARSKQEADAMKLCAGIKEMMDSSSRPDPLKRDY